MSETIKPKTRTEVYLSAIAGDYNGELPKPLTREQVLLEKIAQSQSEKQMDCYTKSETDALLQKKVDQAEGMGLSHNDFTDAEKAKLSGLENYDDSEIFSNIAALETLLNRSAFPRQGSSVRGTWFKFAEYTFPKNANFESSEITFLVSRRVLNTTRGDGILRIRTRYGSAASVFMVSQIYWLVQDGINGTEWALRYNDEEAKVEIYVKLQNVYNGFSCKVMDEKDSTSNNFTRFGTWDLFSPTVGVDALEEEGWTVVLSGYGTAAAYLEEDAE